jgi:serine/threonine-protein kinase
VLWECLTGRRLVDGDDLVAAEQVMIGDFPPPSRFARDLAAAVDEVVMRGLASHPSERWESARDMAVALERSLPRATAPRVASWIERNGREALEQQADRIRGAEAALMAATRHPAGKRALIAVGATLVAAAAVASLALAIGERGGSRPAERATPPLGSGRAPAAPATAVAESPSAPASPAETAQGTTAAARSLRPSVAAAPGVALVRTVSPAPAASEPAEPGGEERSAGGPSDVCRVPYFVNERGLKRYYRECLR